MKVVIENYNYFYFIIYSYLRRNTNETFHAFNERSLCSYLLL